MNCQSCSIHHKRIDIALCKALLGKLVGIEESVFPFHGMF